MIWKDNTVIMAGSESSPLGQRISAAKFGADPWEMRLPVTMFESLKCRVAGDPHGRCSKRYLKVNPGTADSTGVL